MRRIRRVKATAGERTPLDRALVGAYEQYLGARDRFRSSDNEQLSKLYLRSRNLRRNLNGKQLKFVNVDQASLWTLDWIQSFPQRYDLIVGIPRSGMFIASLIALKLGRPLTTPDLFQQGKFWQSQAVKNRQDLNKDSRILLVDDSIDSGRSMEQAVESIRAVNSDFDITRACLIATEASKSSVDLYFTVVTPPRTFEWNLLHRKVASHLPRGCLAVDLDGVLCVNLPPGADDDENRYLEALTTANPYLIPTFEVDAIITCRLEKYRSQTEEWLSKHKVHYRELHMWNLSSKSERHGQLAQHKVSQLLRVKPDMVWESDWDQAQSIWRETRIPTLCVDRMELLS
jgi:orotate phosphoribosyltransferase